MREKYILKTTTDLRKLVGVWSDSWLGVEEKFHVISDIIRDSIQQARPNVSHLEIGFGRRCIIISMS